MVDQLRADDRIQWAGEPAQLEQVWRAISARTDNSHKLWTDDYLAAFAQSAGIVVATLDKGFHERYPSITVATVMFIGSDAFSVRVSDCGDWKPVGR